MGSNMGPDSRCLEGWCSSETRRRGGLGGGVYWEEGWTGCTCPDWPLEVEIVSGSLPSAPRALPVTNDSELWPGDDRSTWCRA